MHNEYWAVADTEDIADKVLQKFQDYQNWGRDSGYFARIKMCYDRFYGFDQDGTLHLETSEDGKVTKANVSHYKSLMQRLHIIVVQNKLAYQPRAHNNDSTSQIESDLARGILEYYGDEMHMHSELSEAVLTCLIALEGYIHCPWNKKAGREVTTDMALNPDAAETIYEGEQEFEVLSAFDVARSATLRKTPYKIVRVKENKYDLAALYPKFADEILNGTIEHTMDEIYIDPACRTAKLSDDEAVFKYILYHDRTPAVENGRRTVICEGQVLSDDELEYDEIPCFQIKPGKILQTTLCDSPAVDLLPLQEALNLLMSAVITNNLNNAVQNIWSPDPSTKVTPLSPFQNLVTSTAEPKGLQLTNSAKETYNLIDSLIAQMQTISGINATVRGQPEASLKSGNSLALMLAQAIQYVSELQTQYAAVAGDVGTCLINNLQKFARTERIAYITGASRKSYARKWKADEIRNINRIACDLGNPIFQSLAGRYEMAERWMQYGVVKNPKVISSFMRTGEIDSATEDDFGDSILIKEENELLRKGINPPVVMSDLHPEHYMAHKSNFNDPEIRNSPELMNATLDHMQEHLNRMKTMDPDMAALLGLQPLPSQMMPPDGPPPGPGGEGELEGDPEVNGQNLPNVPPGTPPEAEAAYQQGIEAIPSTESPLPEDQMI